MARDTLFCQPDEQLAPDRNHRLELCMPGSNARRSVRIAQAGDDRSVEEILKSLAWGSEALSVPFRLPILKALLRGPVFVRVELFFVFYFRPEHEKRVAALLEKHLFIELRQRLPPIRL